MSDTIKEIHHTGHSESVSSQGGFNHSMNPSAFDPKTR